jgi:uncharacterized protein (DUF433 family)
MARRTGRDRLRAVPDADPRFSVPLYTLTEAARYLALPPSTFRNWALGYTSKSATGRAVKGAPILTVLSKDPREPSVPFVGLAEGLVLAAIRRSGVPLQRIRPALEALQQEIGVEHALASRRLYTDGAEVLFDFAESRASDDVAGAVRQLIVLRNNQRVFTEVVEDYLVRIEHDEQGWARLVRLPAYPRGEVVVDATRSFGKPIFESGASRVSDVLDRFMAGESVEVLEQEFGVPSSTIQDAIRVAATGHAA